MSFSQDLKNEIAKKKITRPCCIKAACYAVACFGKYFDARGVVLQTETQSVAQFAKKMYSRCGIKGTVLQRERSMGNIYEFSVKDPHEVEKLLELFGHTGAETNLRINAENIVCSSCVSTFVSTAFLCCGTITDPAKAYNLEFLTQRHNLSKDFEALLGEHEFRAHRGIRKGANVVYIKAGNQIENLLAFMGAGSAAMEFINLKLYKDIRNKANRQSNCDTANVEKAVQAKLAAQRAIRYLQKHNMLDDLPEPLRQAAQRRMENPDMNLAQLGETFVPPLSKSGVAHRMKKLESIAAELQKREQNA